MVETSPESLAVDVSLGRCWVEGRLYEVHSEPVEVALATADATNPRIDRIVVRRSMSNREVTVEALTGTPAADPDPPSLTQNAAGDWEEPLARVFVSANATDVSDSDISDERSFAAALGGRSKIGEFRLEGGQLVLDNIPPTGFSTLRMEGTFKLLGQGDNVPTPQLGRLRLRVNGIDSQSYRYQSRTSGVVATFDGFSIGTHDESFLQFGYAPDDSVSDNFTGEAWVEFRQGSPRNRTMGQSEGWVQPGSNQDNWTWRTTQFRLILSSMIPITSIVIFTPDNDEAFNPAVTQATLYGYP